MNSLDNNFAVLQLEETLHILEDSLQKNVFHHSLELRYIKRLKQLYSPLFDIEHSESGSYYHAALQCIKTHYLGPESTYQIPLSTRFLTSMDHLLVINTYTLDTNNNHAKLIETLLSIAELWGLQSTLDIADLLVLTLDRMRVDLIKTHEGIIKYS